MPEQQKADRWGGPGASHENRDKPRPDPVVKDRDDPDHTSQHSQVSGGGGEGDVHHGADAASKGSGQASDAEKRQD
jgi:hypothetical protein